MLLLFLSAGILFGGCGGGGPFRHHVYPRFGTVSVDMDSGLVSVRFYGSTNPQITNFVAWFFLPGDPSGPREIWYSDSMVYATGNGDRDDNEQIFQFLPQFDLPWDWNGSTPLIGSIPAYLQLRIEDDRGDSAVGAWRIVSGYVSSIEPARSRAPFEWLKVTGGQLDRGKK